MYNNSKFWWLPTSKKWNNNSQNYYLKTITLLHFVFNFLWIFFSFKKVFLWNFLFFFHFKQLILKNLAYTALIISILNISAVPCGILWRCARAFLLHYHLGVQGISGMIFFSLKNSTKNSCFPFCAFLIVVAQ